MLRAHNINLQEDPVTLTELFKDNIYLEKCIMLLGLICCLGVRLTAVRTWIMPLRMSL